MTAMQKGYVIVSDPQEIADMIYAQALRAHRNDVARQPTVANPSPGEWIVTYMSGNGSRVKLKISAA